MGPCSVHNEPFQSKYFSLFYLKYRKHFMVKAKSKLLNSLCNAKNTNWEVLLWLDQSHLFQLRGRSQTTWTNFWPILTTYLPIVDFRGHLVHYLPLVHVDIEKPDHLPPMYNMYLVLQLLLSRKRWGYNFQVFLGLVTNWINIHNQKLPGDVKNISDLT